MQVSRLKKLVEMVRKDEDRKPGTPDEEVKHIPQPLVGAQTQNMKRLDR